MMQLFPAKNDIYMDIDKEIELDEFTQYSFPSFSVKFYCGKRIIIFNEIGKWIVLENDSQYVFFEKLIKHPIYEAIALSQTNQHDFENVLIQIEAKNICKTITFEKSRSNSLHLYLTNACNLRCPHCYMNADIKNENELSLEEIINLTKEFKLSGGDKIILSGGEVLMRPDFSEIVKKCGELMLEVEVLTNGILWNRLILDSIAKYITKVQISIDGYNEEENAKVRGNGSFEKAIRSIDLFAEYDIPIEVAVTPHYDKQLKSKVSNYANFGKWLLSKYSGKITAVKFTGEIFDGRDIVFTDEQKAEYLDIAQKIYQQCFNATGDEAFVEYHKKGGLEGNCNYGNLAIDSIGDIYFCPAINLMKPLGNLRNVNLTTLFSKTAIVKQRSHVDNIKPCKNCDLRYICGGECRAKHFKAFSNCEETLQTQHGERLCDEKTKSYYYTMMIRTNEATFE